MSEESAVKLKAFSGKDDDWPFWSPQFLARAESKGYRCIAEGDEVAPRDDEVLGTSDVRKAKLRQLNKLGYSELLSLMTESRVAFLLVKKARTQGLPNGSLKEAWKNLKDRFEPKGIESVEEVIEMYRECKLQLNEDPEEWIAKKDELRMRLQIDYGKKDYEDDDFKAAIVHDLPEDYHSEKILLRDKYKTMSIQDMMVLLRDRFRELKRDNKSPEKALIMVDGKQKFTGKCFHCGKFRHKKEDCRFKNNGKPDVVKPEGSGKRFMGKCGYCSKPGHKEADCFKKRADEQRRNERANMMVDEGDDEEHVMMAEEEIVKVDDTEAVSSKRVRFSKPEFEIINESASKSGFFEIGNDNDPKSSEFEDQEREQAFPAAETKNELFIADTGATCHLKTSAEGLKNIRKVKSMVKMGSSSVSIDFVGDYDAVIEQTDGTRTKVTIRDVRVAPGAGCNLLSLTRLMKQGYAITGDETGLSVS
jgi:hypothetical protein